MNQLTIPSERIEQAILLIRGHKVMLDRDLAALYQVRPIALRQQVKRNLGRFPSDFMFQLTKTEAQTLVSQNVIPSMKHFGGSLPYAFTEQGVAMLSKIVFEAIRKLTIPPDPKTRPIGFHVKETESKKK